MEHRCRCTWAALCGLAFVLSTRGEPTTCYDSSVPSALAVRRESHQSSVDLVGLFDVHEGSRCHLLRTAGVGQLMTTLGVLEDRLQKRSYLDLNQSEIGFSAYDTCSSIPVTIHRLVYALTHIESLNCQKENFIGVVAALKPEIHEAVSSFLKLLGIPYFPLHVTSLRPEIEALTEVLFDLKWLKVAVFSSILDLEAEFRSEVDRRNICITSSVILASETRSNSFLQKTFQRIFHTGTQVAVVIGATEYLEQLYSASILSNSSIQYWLVAGADAKDSLLSILFGPEHPLILFKRTITSLPQLGTEFSDAYEFGEKIRKLHLVQNYIEYLNSCSRNASGHLMNETRCQDEQVRPVDLSWTVTAKTVDTVLESAQVHLGVEENSNETTQNGTPVDVEETSDQSAPTVEIWTYQHAIGKFSKHKALQVGHYSDGKLSWDIKRLNVFRFMGSGWFKIPEFRCLASCSEVCLNHENISTTSLLENFLGRIYHWKHERWVTVLLTISGVGVLICIVSIIYLVVRTCKDDCEEGNQTCSVVILIAVIFAYSCTVMFMFHNDNSSCSRRITIVGLAYISMLAPILSRCFMMIAAELDGIHAHISGFLQSVLCIFIAAVQIAIASCFWVLYEGAKLKCERDIKLTLACLSYPMFVTLLWVVTSPFCARSHRNNREGVLLHIGSIAVCLVWVAWHLLFFLLPRWNEFTICFGLVATATAIVLVMYLPKIYRMVTLAAVDAHAQVSMQPVIFASSSSRSPNMSIYESVNHGYNPDKDGYVVDAYREDDESPGFRKMTHL